MIVMEPLENGVVVVPEDQDTWAPGDYQAGVDDPGPVETEFEFNEGEQS
jgi:hypothetical protein